MDTLIYAKTAFLLTIITTVTLLSSQPDRLLRKVSGKGFARATAFLARTRISDIDSANEHGQTALHGAAARGHTKTVQNLLSNRADVNIRDNRGITPLELAANGNYIETVEVLLKAAPQHLPQLHRYIRHKMDQVVLCLMRAGVNVNQRDRNGNAPLHLSEREKLTQALLKAGARTTVITAAGKTPLHLALLHHVTEPVIHLLLRHGSPINERDRDGNTPLLVFLQKPDANADLTCCLLESGADPNIRNALGISPFMEAIRTNDATTLVKLLLKFGASPSWEDIATAVDYALSKDDISTLLAMANLGVIISRDLLRNISSKCLQQSIEKQMKKYEDIFDNTFNNLQIPHDLQDIIWDMANG